MAVSSIGRVVRPRRLGDGRAANRIRARHELSANGTRQGVLNESVNLPFIAASGCGAISMASTVVQSEPP
jgi:hypothetical protein